MRMDSILPKLSHNNTNATSDVNVICNDEDDDFHLVCVQSCVCQSSSTQTNMLPSPRQCLVVFDPIVRGHLGEVMT
jgi:hypothetical protein